MTANQFTRALDDLDLDNNSLADLLGYNNRSVRRWAAGLWPVPAAVAYLLNLMLDTESTVDDLRL